MPLDGPSLVSNSLKSNWLAVLLDEDTFRSETTCAVARVGVRILRSSLSKNPGAILRARDILSCLSRACRSSEYALKAVSLASIAADSSETIRWYAITILCSRVKSWYLRCVISSGKGCISYGGEIGVGTLNSGETIIGTFLTSWYVDA